MADCRTCARYLKCKKDDKGPDFICGRYETYSEATQELLQSITGMTHLDVDPDGLTGSFAGEKRKAKSLKKILKRAMDPKNAIPPDIKIDDGDVPEAPNFYEFCMSKKGLATPPLARQLQLFTHLLGEWCPRCTNPAVRFDHFKEFPVDYDVKMAPGDITFLRYGVCPNKKCGVRRTELFRTGELKPYVEIAMAIGQRAGKSIGISLLNAYLLHKYLKLQNLGQVYRQTPNTAFTCTFVGLTFARAKALLYNPLALLVENQPWFKDYRTLLAHYEEKYSEELVVINKESMHWKHRNVILHPMHPSKRLLRGDTRLLAGVDELGWFYNGEGADDREKAAGSEVHEALDNSLGTLRSIYEKYIQPAGLDNVPTAYGLYISSPSAYNDMIMTLLRKFKGSNFSLAAQLATWEMNPDMPRDSLVIRKAYATDYKKAERSWGANPQLTKGSWVDDPTQYLHMFTKRKNALRGYKYKDNDKGSKPRRTAKLGELLTISNTPSILAIDAGETKNSFALTLADLDSDNRPRILGMLEVAPGRERGLDHGLLYEDVILPIVRRFNVKKVLADRWQSSKLVHDLERDTFDPTIQMTKDIKPFVIGEIYSLKLTDFEYLIDMMGDPEECPLLPRMESEYETLFNRDANKYPNCFRYQPVDHFVFQLATVQELGRKIEKGEGYTDDIFRSAMLALNFLYDEDEVEWLNKQGMGTVQSDRRLFAGGMISNGSVKTGAKTGVGIMRTTRG